MSRFMGETRVKSGQIPKTATQKEDFQSMVVFAAMKKNRKKCAFCGKDYSSDQSGEYTTFEQRMTRARKLCLFSVPREITDQEL